MIFCHDWWCLCNLFVGGAGLSTALKFAVIQSSRVISAVSTSYGNLCFFWMLTRKAEREEAEVLSRGFLFLGLPENLCYETEHSLIFAPINIYYTTVCIFVMIQVKTRTWDLRLQEHQLLSTLFEQTSMKWYVMPAELSGRPHLMFLLKAAGNTWETTGLGHVHGSRIRHRS